ncbi:NAD(P)-dependent oxidoreductase [Rhodalgimonas zhirmunskyi]|uniref:NAD(P)-dependent oxidoreductase n=1 Tax=Rhodalgimonas zhirmunskyi TaxID=2964767 RepID=A0AAJ1U9Z5_9RHOB|nr:NAD(P)-dependent oxidoreductase [Rhodoalgimonas zhirmunskyi]MDQ2092711.1 NAD(P)-dependent oxidoreductase [Rhodoalgimonas zhirmunskyi]
MAHSPRTPGIVSNRLDSETLAANFTDLHPPLDRHEAHVAADRCYFCHDAPCMEACPTSIDIPLFIRQIATDTPLAAAKTILEQNILGGMCARVCPTETLCEEVCVRETAEGKPVLIGQLQRYATDAAMAHGPQPFKRAAPTGKQVAVVGAGPAGLSCAHRLAMHGHSVVIYEAREKPGGLNEYGIASYKTVEGFAQKEVDWLLGIGGIEILYDHKLGSDVTLEVLTDKYDAVFLGIGKAGVHGLEAFDLEGVRPAVDFIADLRQAEDLATLPVGRNVVVIGGGMTAVDAAVQAKALGAENVTIAYRRDRGAMPASTFEQDLAAARGVKLVFNANPVSVSGNGAVESVTFEYTTQEGGTLKGTGEEFTLSADQVFLAIGQALDGAPDALARDGSALAADATMQTSHPKVWAGGDCTTQGEDLTVTAVAQGRDAAEAIHLHLTA